MTVNPVTRGGGTLLYPGGQYLRVQRPLLQPGEAPQDTGVIHLHMPGKKSLAAKNREAGEDQTAEPKRTRSRPVRQARTEAKPEAAPESAPAPERQAHAEPRPQRQPEPKPAPRKEAKAAPKAEAKPVKQARADPSAVPTVPGNSAPDYNPGFGYSDQGAAGLNFGLPAAPAAPPAPKPAKPAQMAKANPPPARTAPSSSAAAEAAPPGLTKRSVILFAPQAADPAQSALGAIKFLAGDLSASMTSASARVQIMAYGGTRGDKSSDARRLSLKRALAIRQVLIDDGVPAERIDVRAMGGADDSGPADRVDVYVRA